MALLLLVVALWSYGALRPAELALYDARFQWRGPRPAPQDVIIVTVDDRSLDLLGVEKGSPTRRQFAAMVRRLSAPPSDAPADADKVAAVIAFDYWLPEIALPGPLAIPIFEQMLDLVSRETVLQGAMPATEGAGIFTEFGVLDQAQLAGLRDAPEYAGFFAALDRRGKGVAERMRAIEAQMGFPGGLSPNYRRLLFPNTVQTLQGDLELASAIEQSGTPVVLARFISNEGDRLPDPLFASVSMPGLINALKDPDGAMRSIPAAGQGVFGNRNDLDVGDQRVVPPLALAALAAAEGEFDLNPKGVNAHLNTHPLAADGKVWVDFYGPRRTFRRIPLYRVLDHADPAHSLLNPARVRADDAAVARGDLPKRQAPLVAGEVAGAIVFVGDVTPAGQDFVATPFSGVRRGADTDVALNTTEADTTYGEITDMPGVEFHCNVLAAVRANRAMHYATPAVVMVWLLGIAAWGTLFYWPAVGFRGATLIALLSAGCLAVTNYWLFASQLYLLDLVPLMLLLALQFIAGASVQGAVQAAKRKQVTQLFGRYLSPKVVKRMVEGEGGVEMSGRTATLTTFFSDIRGFTKLAEQLNAKEIAEVLQDYFERMIGVVFDHEGTLDKLMGDAIMAFWGAPEEQSNHAARACEAALHTIVELERLKAEDARPVMSQINIGIGINTGEVTVGNLGSQKFVDYTVLGDPVNLASRFEGQNKEYGTRVIVGEATVQDAGDAFVFRELDSITVKGRNAPVSVYELIGRAAEVPPARLGELETFAAGLRDWRAGRFEAAKQHFERVLAQNPEDGPSATFTRRCEEYLAVPPAGEWIGVYVARSK